MTYQEAKRAIKKRLKIKSGGIIYKHINAIIFRKTDEIEQVELELQDVKANSVTICKMEQAEVLDET